jgi:hypothetical protein
MLGGKLKADSCRHVWRREDIRADPAFRAQFHAMCANIGVDPLASNKGVWAQARPALSIMRAALMGAPFLQLQSGRLTCQRARRRARHM